MEFCGFFYFFENIKKPEKNSKLQISYFNNKVKNNLTKYITYTIIIYYSIIMLIIITASRVYAREGVSNSRMSAREFPVLLGPLNARSGRPRDVTAEFHAPARSHVSCSRRQNGARWRCNHQKHHY